MAVPVIFLASCGVTRAAWLAVCRGATASHPIMAREYLNPAHPSQSLAIYAQKPVSVDCSSMDLSVPPDQVIWTALIPSDLTPTLDDGVIIQGSGELPDLKVSEIYPPVSPSDDQPMAMPLETELLHRLDITPWGRSGRVQVTPSGNGFRVESKAGSSAAGAVLRGPYFLPPEISLSLLLNVSGSGEYQLALADSARANRESPMTFGTFHATREERTIQLPVPASGIDRSHWANLTLICPNSSASLTINSVQLVARESPTERSPRSTWAWQPDLWLKTPDELLDRLHRIRASTVFITVPVSQGTVTDPAELATFIRSATLRGIRVWAVSGDPHAVFPDERGKFVKMAQAYASYNRSVSPDARLWGLQFDIEPYVLPGFALDPESWNAAYLSTIQDIKRATDLPLEVVLPFWYAKQKVRDDSFLDRLADSVDSVAVMDYRTDPVQIQQFAEPFLDWGERRHRPVRIALESGPINDERQYHYRPAPTGELWLSHVGDSDALVLLKKPMANPNGQAFEYSFTGTYPGSRVTFHGKKTEFDAIAPKLEAQFGAWRCFAGLALHEYY